MGEVEAETGGFAANRAANSDLSISERQCTERIYTAHKTNKSAIQTGRFHQSEGCTQEWLRSNFHNGIVYITARFVLAFHGGGLQ